MAAGSSKLVTAAPAILIFAFMGGATYAQVTTDGTVGPRVQLGGPEFEIGADLGTRAGRNLFHSFERFSLDSGERATFSGPDAIRNVISRVTGGEPSDIHGTIRSTIAGADFYFLNPAGVVFGPNASLDVQGSFHVSTADELRLADGAKFSATSPSASSFTVAAPEAFGFLGAEPRAITVERGTLAVPAGEALSLIGGDITIDGGNNGAASGGDQGLVRAEAGQITLTAAGGPGEARLSSGDMMVEEAAAITLVDQAFIDASGDGGGTIRIRGGEIIADGDVQVFADNNGARNGRGGLDIDAEVLRVRRGSALTADALNEGTGGDIVVRAGVIEVNGGSRLAGDTFAVGGAGTVTVTAGDLAIREGGSIRSNTAGQGDAGTVTVEADRLRINGQRLPTGILSETRIATNDGQNAIGEGNAGSVTVTAGELQIRNAGLVSSTTFGQGNAGAVTVDAERLLIDNEGSPFATGILSSAAALVTEDGQLLAVGQGNARSVSVTAGEVEIHNAGQIGSNTIGRGDAGTVTVEADSLSIDGQGRGTGITSETQAQVFVNSAGQLLVVAEGDAGSVSVTAGQLEIRNAGTISSTTFSRGNAGVVTVVVDHLLIDNQGSQFATGIVSDANPFVSSDGRQVVAGGDAGTVTVTANRMRLINGGAITSDTQGKGDGGNVVIHAREALNLDGGFIGAEAEAVVSTDGQVVVAEGNAGAVTVRAGELEVRNAGTISSTTLGPGNAGTVEVIADALTMSDFSFIRSEAISDVLSTGETIVSNADSSGVTITSETITMSGSSQISSSVAGDGNAGPIVVMSISIDIEGDDGNLATGILSEAAARAFAETGDIISLSNGNAGKVTVVADDIRIRNGARISSNVVGEGQAGNVFVRTRGLTIENERRLAEDTGIVSNASNTVRGDGTVIASSDGTAGRVSVVADQVDIGASGEITSVTVGAGNSGTVNVSAPLVIVHDGGQISTSAVGAGEAGKVIVRAPDRLLLDGGTISTDSARAGGGEIRLLVGNVIDLHDSEVVTSVAGGDDPTAGNVTIDPKILIIDGSRIQANAGDAPRGEGGEITIIADNILVPGSDFQALVDRKDISATGGPAGVDGTIVVNAPEVDLAGGLVVLEGALLDAASQLRERCGARRDIGASSFTGVGRGGLPASPDAPLASGYADADGRVGETPAKAASGRVDEAAWPSSVRLVGLAPCRSWD